MQVRTLLLLYSLIAAIGFASSAIGLPMPLRAGDILVAAHGTGDLIRIDPITGAQDVFASLPDPTDVAVSDSGDIYVTNQFGGVWRVDPSN